MYQNVSERNILKEYAEPFIIGCKIYKKNTTKISSLRINFRENIEPSLIALGCKNPFGWPFRKLSVLLNKGEKKRGIEFALRILNDRTLHYIWYSIDSEEHKAYVAQGQDHQQQLTAKYYTVV